MGNGTSMQIEVKMPEFSDENSSNPLEFIENFERFCLMKYIGNNNKLRVLNAALHGKARHWYELQQNILDFVHIKTTFQNEFNNTTIQINFKDKWLSKRFNSKEDKSLQTYYYKQLKQANYLRPKLTQYEKNFSIIEQFLISARKS